MGNIRNLREERPSGCKDVVLFCYLYKQLDRVQSVIQYDGHLNTRGFDEMHEIFTQDRMDASKHIDVYWCYKDEFERRLFNERKN